MSAELANVDRPAAPAANNEPARLPLGSRGIVICDMDGLARFARMYYASGLAPKGMNEAAIGVAIQMGLEVGLTPAQAVQSIAVINGRPGLFGPAALALVEASGLLVEIDEHFESGGKRADGLAAFADSDAAVCVTRRKGRKAVVTRFSVADAKRAGLWGKAGPWSQYPQRMLKWRARGFNLGDNFGDVLRGLKTVEELQDYPDVPAPEAAAVLPMPRPAEAPPAPAKQLPAKREATWAELADKLKAKDAELSAAGVIGVGDLLAKVEQVWADAGLEGDGATWDRAQVKRAVELAAECVRKAEPGDAAE